MVSKPPVVVQGTAVAEEQGDGSYLVMLPSGKVMYAADHDAAEGLIRRYAKRITGRGDMGVLIIDWRLT